MAMNRPDVKVQIFIFHTGIVSCCEANFIKDRIVITDSRRFFACHHRIDTTS